MAMYWASKKTANTFFGKLIKLRAWNPFSPGRQLYCHSEIVFSDNSWISAREASNAVNFVTPGPPAGDKYSDYDYILLPVTPEQEAEMRRWAERNRLKSDGKTPCGYDKVAILFQFLPIPIAWQSRENWFCTEFCAAMAKVAGFFAGRTEAGLQPTDAHYIVLDEIAAIRLEAIAAMA